VKFTYANIEAYFDEIISSHDLGIAKEEAGFWDQLASRRDFNPERSLFIDDNLHVLREAKAHGIKHLLAIEQPDSQQGQKDTQEFEGIRCFSQLLTR
jgi:putative hydrolase of the HAD superfamily